MCSSYRHSVHIKDFKMMVPSKGNSTENQTQKYGKFHSLKFNDTVYK